ncbi:MAG: 6,7-dimethyl-8-ribityllumazine synthase [Opitutaceae bacterium]|nr:6,7-dimethyl-8-ribityllumazine synthase [Opitutaceae bacterium]
MSLDAPTPQAIDARTFRVGIAAARFNANLVDALLHQVFEHLVKSGIPESGIKVVRVPGSNELPAAAQMLAEVQVPDVVIALGLLIRGDTIHYELIAGSATDGLQRVALDTRIPVINGVIVAENAQQAQDRCLGKINRGEEFARAAIEMAELRRRFHP